MRRGPALATSLHEEVPCISDHLSFSAWSLNSEAFGFSWTAFHASTKKVTLVHLKKKPSPWLRTSFSLTCQSAISPWLWAIFIPCSFWTWAITTPTGPQDAPAQSLCGPFCFVFSLQIAAPSSTRHWILLLTCGKNETQLNQLHGVAVCVASNRQWPTPCR